MAKKKAAKKSSRVRAAKPLTARYIYVEARGWFNEVLLHESSDYNVARVLDGAISFDHIIVTARTEEDAYYLGIAQLKERQDKETPRDLDHPEDFEAGSHVTGDFLNDYVVKL